MLLDQWLQMSDTIGRRVLFGFDVQNGPRYEARVKGLDSEGGLILLLGDGTEVVEYSGEVVYLD
jgi:BirA family biotin operon repressor/biotin-[acetyl-CoA-carboxylase] ligase